MKQDTDFPFSLIILMLCLWTGGFHLGKYTSSCTNEAVKLDTITVVMHDTVISVQPKETVRYVYRTKIDTLRTIDSIPIAVEIPIETAQFTDTLTNENDTISYNAFVSGYQPILDSLQVFYNKHEHTIIQTIPQKPKRWHWGITSGYFIGYDISHKQVANGLGVCVGMNYMF
ncbi:MAG: hypothetical protein MJ197_03615 [Bacteroidales bacterium]|nr:hypothetical protein [Bacteroidales bacterium]